jgi:hypothetical protein
MGRCADAPPGDRIGVPERAADRDGRLPDLDDGPGDEWLVDQAIGLPPV